MTPEEKSLLQEEALHIALSKMQAVSAIQAHISAAITACRDWENAHHTFADSQLYDLRNKLQELLWSMPNDFDRVCCAITGNEPDYYSDGNDILDLRRKEAAESQGVAIDDDNDDDMDWLLIKLPDEQPLDLYLRLRDVICVADTIELTALAKIIGVRSSQVIKKLWDMGITGVDISSWIDFDTAKVVASSFGREVQYSAFKKKEAP